LRSKLDFMKGRKKSADDGSASDSLISTKDSIKAELREKITSQRASRGLLRRPSTSSGRSMMMTKMQAVDEDVVSSNVDVPIPRRASLQETKDDDNYTSWSELDSAIQLAATKSLNEK
jgi:hypothetical protein